MVIERNIIKIMYLKKKIYRYIHTHTYKVCPEKVQPLLMERFV